MHPHVQESWLVHVFAWMPVLAFFVVAAVVIALVFGPRLGALLVGLGA